jgi:uncharacterized protein (TIGR02147 family)
MSAKTFFEFTNYKELIQTRIRSMPNKGRGEFRKIASHLRMHTTRVSHVFNGAEQLTPEQASTLASYFGFSNLETEYFIALVNLERAGNEDLRRVLRRQCEQILERSKQLVQRLPSDRVFTEQEKAVFYSNWYYSGIRLLTSVEGYNDLDRIAQRFDLPRNLVKRILEFLVATGLCVEKNGRYEMGPKKTHLEADSPMVTRMHANWRMLAMSRHPKLSAAELAFSAPMSLRAEDAPRIRELLMQTIEQVIKIPASTEKPDKLSCLTIDWFDF